MLDPQKLSEAPPAEILEAAAKGYLGLDHRFLHALLDRPDESLPALLEFAERDRISDPIDLAPELIAIFHYWKTPEAIPFFIGYIEEDPTDIPDEVVETMVEFGQSALEPLLALYQRLDESESGEVAFILANLRIKDDRILQLLLERLEYDLSDTILLLGVYGDPRARGSLEAAAVDLTPEDSELKRDIEDALETLDGHAASVAEQSTPDVPFDIWSGYPEEADLPVESLDEDERIRLLETASSDSTRAAAAASFFNCELTQGQIQSLLNAAKTDRSPTVRARAWEALMPVTDDTDVVTPMLEALRNSETTLEERSGLVVGLAPEADRNEVHDAIVSLYDDGSYRAKALEAMWRSMRPAFQDYFAPHITDDDIEIRRGAVWGIGYFGVKTELDGLRKLFENEDLRSDALFAYALALPGETSRSRMQSMLSKIEKDAKGLTELEEDLVKAALDERLLLAGKEPVFAQQQD